MNIKEVCKELDNSEGVDYVPYHYEVKMISPDVGKHGERDMWLAQGEKQDIISADSNYYGTIDIYSLHSLAIPTKKKIFDTTYKFEVKVSVASKVGGVEKAIKNILEKFCKVSSSALRECFTYQLDPIKFKYLDYKYVPREISNYIAYRIGDICKENKIQYYYNFNADEVTLLSFKAIPEAIIKQIKKEFGEYIKNENC